MPVPWRRHPGAPPAPPSDNSLDQFSTLLQVSHPGAAGSLHAWLLAVPGSVAPESLARGRLLTASWIFSSAESVDLITAALGQRLQKGSFHRRQNLGPRLGWHPGPAPCWWIIFTPTLPQGWTSWGYREGGRSVPAAGMARGLFLLSRGQPGSS